MNPLDQQTVSLLRRRFGIDLAGQATASPMTPADIQHALRKAGSSQQQIATELGVTRQSVCGVVASHPNCRSERIARAISRTTGIPVNTLWPGVYAGRITTSIRRTA